MSSYSFFCFIAISLLVTAQHPRGSTLFRKFISRNPMIRVNGSLVQKVPMTYLPAPRSSNAVSAGPLARVINNYNTAALPCCRDRFGEQACQSLRKTQTAVFEKRCLNDHDFHTLDCCAECRAYIDSHKIHPDNARHLFKAPQLCKDKHSLTFCRRFKASGLGKFSCADAEFAVRVCRHSCGYCNDGLYAASKASPLCNAPVKLNLTDIML